MHVLRLHCGAHALACKNDYGVHCASTQCQFDQRCRTNARSTRHRRPAAVSAAAAIVAAPRDVSKPPNIPQHLRKYVAHVEVADSKSRVQVYILGVSHVSRQSCRQTDQLIETVQPETVLLELCKDRVDLLIDPSSSAPQHWHTRNTDLQGLMRQQSSSMAETCRQIAAHLHCQPGQTFSAHDIEQDCVQLLSSGVFGSVQPANKQASLADAPLFIHSKKQMHLVAPMGGLNFKVTLRNLPPMQSISLKPSHQKATIELEQILQTATKGSQQGNNTVAALVETHSKLQAALKAHGHQHVSIAFYGLDTGRIEADINDVKSAQEASITGLEASAKSGKGYAIKPFQPSMPQVPFNDETHSSNAGDEEAVLWRRWSAQEMQSAPSTADDSAAGSVNAFTSFVTQTYAKYQREAGERVGVRGGEAWRAAFTAAANHGATQVLLGDKPAVAMSQRMSQGIWNGTAPFLGASLLLALAAVTSAATHLPAPEAAPVAAVAALGLLAKGLYSTLGPLLEIRKLSQMSAQEIEAAVDPKESLQNGSQEVVKLWGEDALLSWPGAMDVVIHDRDAYMAKVIWSAATGKAGCPAFVKQSQEGLQTWQYVMPANPVEPSACPVGFGSGVYSGGRGVRSVVAVVGSAHVRGIVSQLQNLQAESKA